MKEKKFGTYAGELVEWLVLDEDGTSELLITKHCIDSKPYNDELVPTSWEECSLRKWLNNEFFSAAFSDEEKLRVMEVNLDNFENPRFKTEGGGPTRDRVFILSACEAEKYFDSCAARMAMPTEAARQNGIFMSWNHPWWWLRTPGNYPNIACEVYYDGYVDYLGHSVNFTGDGVRPVIRVCK